jgi:hypothetical protein
MTELITVSTLAASSWVLLSIGGPSLAQKIRAASRSPRNARREP